MSDLQALLVVQERDTETDQLRYRRTHLPEAVRLAEITSRLTALENEGVTVTAERDDLQKRQASLEAELAEIEKRATGLDQQMRSGSVTASKDLQAMADQIGALKRRQSDLEDSELEVMEALDPLEARLTEVQDQWAALDIEAIALRAAVAEAEVEIDAELTQVRAARAAAASGIPEPLMKAYERLRSRLGGVGAAPLVGSSCGGCHLTLSASELDQIQRLGADAIPTCEQCGRILVR